MTDESILQRAFRLAASGECSSLSDIEKALKREGFIQVTDHLAAPTLRAQLKKHMKDPTGPGGGSTIGVGLEALGCAPERWSARPNSGD